jgi:hypothetical protein
MQVIPDSFDYSEQLNHLPKGVQNTLISCSPNNGSSFTYGQIIQVDLLTRGSIDPESLSIRYKLSTTNVVGTLMCGTPVYTPFAKLETQINSQTIESISNYNVLCNNLVNVSMDVSQKYGRQPCYGYNGNGTTSSLESMDGRTMAVNEVNTYSAPLICMLSNAEKVIPAYLSTGIRLLFTVDVAANMFANTFTASAFAITNFEVVYNLISIPDLESRVMNSNIPFNIKSNSYNVSSYPLNVSGGAGNITLPFSISYSSIRALFFHFASTTGTGTVNGVYDSPDPTNGSGSYQISVSGVCYPQKPLNTFDNKSSIMQELYRTQGSIFNANNSMSIDNVEFYAIDGTTTTIDKPAKFLLGFNLNVVQYNNIFSGLNSNNSPINLLITTNGAILAAHNTLMLTNYDCLIQFDPSTKTVIIVK